MILIPIENVDGAFVIDNMLCIKPEAIENSPAPKLLELFQLWSRHGDGLSQEIFHRYNRNALPENETIEFHENYGWGHWTIWVDDPEQKRRSLYEIEQIEDRKQKRTETREREITPGHIYLLESDNGFHKIGRTTQEVEKRARQLERDFPIKLRVVHSFPADDVMTAERTLLNAYEYKKVQGEWFDLDSHEIKNIQSLSGFSDGHFYMEKDNDSR